MEWISTLLSIRSIYKKSSVKLQLIISQRHWFIMIIITRMRHEKFHYHLSIWSIWLSSTFPYKKLLIIYISSVFGPQHATSKTNMCMFARSLIGLTLMAIHSSKGHSEWALNLEGKAEEFHLGKILWVDKFLGLLW